MNISIPDLVNALLIAAGLGVCALCFLQITSSPHMEKKVRRFFQLFFILIAFYISAHLVRELMNGLPGSGVHTALGIVTFAETLAAGFMAYMMSMIVVTVAKTGNKEKSYFAVFLVLVLLHTAILAVGQSSDLIFYFDEANIYHRASAYLLSNVSPVLMLLTDVVILIRYRGNMAGRIKTAFWTYMIAPTIAIAIQSFFYDIQFIIVATVVAAVYTFLVVVRDQNDEYQKKQMENSRIETELAMASSIQADMVPNIYPAFPDRKEFDIYASMTPAKEVGGDFYDFFLVDDDHLCMVMADVSGKGVPAALFMMVSKIILANNAMMGKTPGQILTDTNAAMCSHNREEMFVTVWLGILEISTGKLTAANAGHESPIVKAPDGEFRETTDRHGLVLGGMEGLRYKDYEMTLEPGSKLFLYTDGVPEAIDARENMFGAERMIAALNEEKDAPPGKILKNVRAAIDSFVKDAEQFDDLTMMCLEVISRGENKDDETKA